MEDIPLSSLSLPHLNPLQAAFSQPDKDENMTANNKCNVIAYYIRSCIYMTTLTYRFVDVASIFIHKINGIVYMYSQNFWINWGRIGTPDRFLLLPVSLLGRLTFYIYPGNQSSRQCLPRLGSEGKSPHKVKDRKNKNRDVTFCIRNLKPNWAG